MLQDAIEATLKTYKDSVEQLDLNSNSRLHEFQYRWSGCYAFDWVLANESTKGGLVRGIIIEVSGPENSGKTTLLTIAAASVQKYPKRNQVLFLDFEHKYNLNYAYEYGLDKHPDKLAFVMPRGSNPGESGFKLMEKSIDDPDCGLVAVDSFAAILSKEEIAGELTDANIGKTAMLQSKGVKKIVDRMQRFSPTVIFNNQIRDKIGGYGATETTTGARALKFYAAVRIDVRQVAKYKDKHDNMVGARIKITGKKNQVSRNFVVAEIDIWFGRGFDNIGFVIDKAKDLEVLEKKKSKYLWEGEWYSETQLTEILFDDKKLKKLYKLCVLKNNSLVKAHLDNLDLKQGRVKKNLQEVNSEKVEDLSPSEE